MTEHPPDQAPAGSPPPPASRRRWAVILFAAVVLAVGVYRFWSPGSGTAAGDAPQAGSAPAGAHGPSGPGGRPVPVVAEPARSGDIRVYLDGLGAVTPLASVTVRSRVDGQLMAVHFQEGQMVRAGDLLAEIDPRPFQVQLTQAAGQLAKDQALLANAQVDLQRYRKLWAQDSIPKQQLDTQEALVRQYTAAIDTDRGQVDAAKLQLTYSRIVAPVSGRLGLRLVDAGNMIHATDAGGLVTITQIRPIAVVFSIPEDDLPNVRARMQGGDAPTVEVYDREGTRRIATGTLLTVDNTIDPTTGTVKLKAQFPNEDDALFPNQFVNARLLLDVRRGATLVPGVAVRRGTQGAYVYVVTPKQTVQVRPVRVGVNEGNDTSIDEGLAPGDVVVTDGADALRDGMVVTPKTPGRAAAEQGHS
jgi:membrane fusion protein, multidrug efflux system